MMYEEIAMKVWSETVAERANAVNRGASTDRLRHLDLQIETINQVTLRLANVTDKAEALAIVQAEYDVAHGADIRDDAAADTPLMILRDRITAS